MIDRDGDGIRESADGTPARFSLLTQKGNAVRERAASYLQQELAKVGLGVDLVLLEVGALVERITTGSYEAAWFGAPKSDTDPDTHLDFWLSSGSFHVWHPEQATPGTSWERRIDELMGAMVASTDDIERKRLFFEVQKEFAAEMPVIHFAAPHVVIAMSSRVGNARPALLQPSVLWDAEHLTSSGGAPDGMPARVASAPSR